jgi:hypothetical protein
MAVGEDEDATLAADEILARTGVETAIEEGITEVAKVVWGGADTEELVKTEVAKVVWGGAATGELVKYTNSQESSSNALTVAAAARLTRIDRLKNIMV